MDGRPRQAGNGLWGALVRRLEAEQERWHCWVPVLLGCGIGAYFALPEEPLLVVALAPLAAVLALRFAVRPVGIGGQLVLGGMIAVSLGFALAKARVELVRAPVLAKQINSAEVRGYVELVEPRAGGGQRLTLRVTAIDRLAPEAMPQRVRITSRRVLAGVYPGDAVRARATLMPPSQPSLPGDYDFGRQAWFSGLGAVGYSIAAPQRDASAPPPPADLRFWAQVQRWRQQIGDRVTAALPGETGAIANALITGQRGGISDETNDAFRDSGILHILSISGFHMAIMAGSVFLFVRVLLAAIPALALRYPIKKWAAGAALAGALGYLMISGAEFATVRSTIMISIMFIAVMLGRSALALRNVVLAATVILVLFPESLLNVGFQMSFAAVLGLVSAYEAMRQRDLWSFLGERPGMRVAVFFAGIVLTTLVASVAVAPFAAYHFHKSQQYAVLANLIVVPLCNLLIMPAALAALILMPLGLEYWPLYVMGLGIEVMVWTARAVAELPGAVFGVPAMPASAFLLMVLGGLWLMLWRTRWRVAGIAAIAGGIALAPTLPQADVLVGRDGQLVAVRGPDGMLSVIGGRQASFEVQRWLEHEGAGGEAREAVAGRQFVCDGIGCVATVKGLRLAVSRHPAAFGEDCRRADVVIAPIVSPRDCIGPRAVVDFFAARREGSHALYIGEGGAVRIVTVAAERGQRPWSTPARERASSSASGRADQ
jgi:competence protein ComEC